MRVIRTHDFLGSLNWVQMNYVLFDSLGLQPKVLRLRSPPNFLGLQLDMLKIKWLANFLRTWGVEDQTTIKFSVPPNWFGENCEFHDVVDLLVELLKIKWLLHFLGLFAKLRIRHNASWLRFFKSNKPSILNALLENMASIIKHIQLHVAYGINDMAFWITQSKRLAIKTIFFPLVMVFGEVNWATT